MATVGVVIPVGRGRERNLKAVLESLENQRTQPDEIVVVFDGPNAVRRIPDGPTVLVVPKHQPGMEQPRNSGVSALPDTIDIAWFVDSDVILDPEALDGMLDRWRSGYVVIGPYDWMGPGCREPQPDLFNDMRWDMFREERWQYPGYVSVGEYNVGLACFSGNLAWDREAFIEIGGFWSGLHHGRCEDGELGLRAVAARTPITCAPRARGWHLHHPVDAEWVRAANARDVPLINERHPRHPVTGHFLEDSR